MTVKERLIEYIKSIGISQGKFEKSVGLSNGYVNNIRKSIQPDKIQSISLCYPSLNTGWLLTGEGAMLRESEESKNAEPSYNVKYPVRPFIDIAYGSCGDQKGFGLSVKKRDCEGLSLPINTEYDFSIKASGDSMINRMRPERSIRSGDIVACRSWKSRNHVRWGEVYALATEDGVIIKKVEQSAKEDSIRCVSFNIEENYLPYEIPTNEIHDWALVVGVVSVVAWN